MADENKVNNSPENQGSQNQNVLSNLRKNVKQINKEYKTKDLLVKTAAIITIFFLICFGALAISKKYGGNFEINLGNGRRVISLCETPDFEKATDALDVAIPERMNNISFTSLPEDIDAIDGEHNGKDYMAYTFYLKNMGNKKLSYYNNLRILRYEKKLDECIRVMVYLNGVPTYYAKGKKGTTGIEGVTPEPEQVFYEDSHAKWFELIWTTPFQDNENAYNILREDLQPGEIDKYTFVVWIEGSDPETSDDKRSGQVKMDIVFTVKEELEEDE